MRQLFLCFLFQRTFYLMICDIIQMYIPEDEETIERFYTDILNSVAFNTPLSYLTKYPQIQDYTIIVETQDNVLKSLYSIISKDIDKTSKIAELLTAQSVNETLVPILAKIINNKLPDMRQSILRRQISRGGACLMDNNWRIVNIMSTSWSAFTSKVLLQLTLIIENSNREQIKEVTLQMNVHEVESFLGKLKLIKKSLKS